jgi:hypothetical protein
MHPRTFRSVRATDGKIAIDEDNATPVFSYAGCTVLFAKAGDRSSRPAAVRRRGRRHGAGQNDFLNADRFQ